MSRSLIASALSAFAAVSLLSVPSLAADDKQIPLRKAGKWELKTVMDEGFGPREQVLTMCIDADMERNTAQASDVSHKQNCTKYEVKREGDTTTVDARCVFKGRNVESLTEMSGDFAATFKVVIKSRTWGTEHGQSVSVERTITQDGTYLGASCGELKAGEAMGTDGHKIMVQ